MNLQHPISTVLIATIACLTIYACKGQSKTSDVPRGNSSALIELYTSEGCSSCPSAEALMPKLKEQYRDKLYVLEFHVDYWDRLGWKDPFSQKAFSNRQNRYAAVFNSESVYTPQGIVNGKAHTTGSNSQKLQELINKELKLSAPNSNIAITVKAAGTYRILVSYTTTLAANESLNIALVQLQATTNVKRGENSGRQLKHENIVRSFETVKGNKGELSFTLPENLPAAQFHIIAYIQQNDNLYITAVREVDIEE